MSPAKTALSAALKLARARRDMTLAQAAPVLNVTLTTLRAWEDGNHRPNPDSFADIAKFLEMPEWAVELLLSIRVAEAVDPANLPERALMAMCLQVEIQSKDLAGARDLIQFLRELLSFGVNHYQPRAGSPSDAGA